MGRAYDSWGGHRHRHAVGDDGVRDGVAGVCVLGWVLARDGVGHACFPPCQHLPWDRYSGGGRHTMTQMHPRIPKPHPRQRRRKQHLALRLRIIRIPHRPRQVLYRRL